ncbi:MAG: BamA/TamA family outer membrane protein [bacterium]
MRFFVLLAVCLLATVGTDAACAAPAPPLPVEPYELTLQEIRVAAGGEIEKSVLRLIPLEVGANIDPAVLVHTREALEASTILKNVDIYTERGDRPGAVILHVDAEYEQRFHLETGLGREPMQGWYLNLIGARYTNPLLRGGHVRIGLREFERNHGIFLEAEYPRLLGNNLDLLINLENGWESWHVTEGDRLMFQTIMRTKTMVGLRKWSRDDLTVSLWLGMSHHEPEGDLEGDEGNVIETAGRLVPEPDDKKHHLDLRLDLTWDRLDPSRPWQQGQWAGLRLKGSEIIDGKAFWGAELEGQIAIPVARIHALALRARGEYTGGGTPYHLRPVVGGIGSLRGFEVASLSGPLGARAFWQFNCEWRQALVGDNPRQPKVTGTFFVDVGDLWQDDGSRFGVAASAGYGLLLRIPWIQILNAEVSYPLTRNVTDDAVVLYLSLGRSF